MKKKDNNKERIKIEKKRNEEEIRNERKGGYKCNVIWQVQIVGRAGGWFLEKEREKKKQEKRESTRVGS